MTIIIVMRRDSEYAYPCSRNSCCHGFGVCRCQRAGRTAGTRRGMSTLVYYQYLGINGLSSQEFCLSHLVNRRLSIHACSTGTLRSHALYTTTKPINSATRVCRAVEGCCSWWFQLNTCKRQCWRFGFRSIMFELNRVDRCFCGLLCDLHNILLAQYLHSALSHKVGTLEWEYASLYLVSDRSCPEP